MCTSLWVLNYVSGCGSDERVGGDSPDSSTDAKFCVPEEGMFDENVACNAVAGNEFIFDIQTHHFRREDLDRFPTYIELFGDLFDSTTEDIYIDQMFCDSDTTMAALSSWPGIACTDAVPLDGGQCGLPLSNESNARSRDHINQLAKRTQRIVNHFQVMAQDGAGVEGQLLLMEQLKCTLSPAAWKLYPGFSIPKAFTMDDAIGRAVIEKGIELGVPVFCIHKGLPIGAFFDVELGNHPREIGRVAKEYPEAKFIIYHSGICTGFASCRDAPPEGPYDENEENPVGVNAFIRSVVSAGLPPNSNVYGEIGSSYNRASVYQDATVSAHYFGKLMKYIGTNNICWGTDCVISGSPQPYIEAFRLLEIPQTMREEFDYPALDNTTPEGKLNKAKILGLNAARAYGVDPEKIRCALDQCPVTARKKLMDEELGPRRWSFRGPAGPRTYEAFLEQAYAAAALGRPG
jgi:uncharacterized protein